MFLYFTQVRPRGQDNVALAQNTERPVASRNQGWVKAAPQAGGRAKLAKNYGKLPLSFEPNRGQTDPQVKFLSRGRGYGLFLTGSEAVLALRNASREPKAGNGPLPGTKNDRLRTTDALFPSLIKNPESQFAEAAPSAADIQRRPSTTALRMKLLGANPAAKVTGMDRLAGKSNYFIGNDPKKWRTNVANYAKVKYDEVYPGIDLVYYGNQGQLEYDFVVEPGADPKAIALDIEGAGEPEIDNAGDLVVDLGDGGEVRLHKPVVYQRVLNRGHRIERLPLDGKYVLLADNKIGFEVPAYDKTQPLIIDPVLTYSTYLGGTDFEFARSIAADDAGNAYVAGTTFSSDFPTASPLQSLCDNWRLTHLYNGVRRPR